MTGAALALATPMMRISQGGTAANDIVGVFFLLAAVAMVANADLPAPWRAAPLVVAAIAAGLAVSVKLSLLAPVLALTVGTILLARRGHRGRAAAAWIPAFVLAGGYWYVRNLLAVGNPLPWVGLGILTTPAAPLQQHTGFAIVHYATDTQIWTRFFGPGLVSGLGSWWLAVVAVAVLGPLLCVLGPSQRMARMLGLVALASLAAYLITPETAAGPAGDPSGFAFNLRYARPGADARARGGSARALARRSPCAGRAGRARRIARGHARREPAVGRRHAAGAMIRSGWPRSSAPGWHARASVLRPGGADGGASSSSRRGSAGYRWPAPLPARPLHLPAERVLSGDGVGVCRTVHTPGCVVGTFGGFFAYPFFGLDVSNRVQYVAHRGPHGSFTQIPTCLAGVTAIDAGTT